MSKVQTGIFVYWAKIAENFVHGKKVQTDRPHFIPEGFEVHNYDENVRNRGGQKWEAARERVWFD